MVIKNTKVGEEMMGEIDGVESFYFNGIKVGSQDYKAIIMIGTEHANNPETVTRIYEFSVDYFFQKNGINRVLIDIVATRKMHIERLMKMGFRELVDPNSYVVNMKTFYCTRDRFKPTS